MAETTSVLKLTKPAYSEAADIAVINANMDTIDTAVSARTYPHNLLVNSYFPSDCVVNQRGVTTWTPSAYNIDMWYQNAHGVVTNTANGIRIDNTAGTETATVVQYVPVYRDDEDYTFAAKVNGEVKNRTKHFKGTAAATEVHTSASYTGGYLDLLYSSGRSAIQVVIRCNAGYAIEVEWAALYQGDYRYVLPQYVWKGYAAELAECQRYYVRFGRYISTGFLGLACRISATTCRATFPLPAAMAKMYPSVAFSLCKVNGVDVTGMSNTEAIGHIVTATATCDASAMGWNAPLMFSVGSGGYVEFSAEP